MSQLFFYDIYQGICTDWFITRGSCSNAVRILELEHKAFNLRLLIKLPISVRAYQQVVLNGKLLHTWSPTNAFCVATGITILGPLLFLVFIK